MSVSSSSMCGQHTGCSTYQAAWHLITEQPPRRAASSHCALCDSRKVQKIRLLKGVKISMNDNGVLLGTDDPHKEPPSLINGTSNLV